MAVSETLVFNPEEAVKCFAVPILDDELNEPTEHLTIIISTVPDGVTVGDPATTVVSIVDDDSKR